MADMLTLTLVGVGGGGLALWFASRAAERRTQVTRLVKGVPTMAADDDVLAQATANLPAKLDARELERRVMENLAVFKEAPSLLDQFFLKVRSKYSSKWEAEVLADVKMLLTQQIEVMELGARHAGVRRTLPERTETEMYKAKTENLSAKMQYEDALAASNISGKVAIAKAQTQILSASADAAEQRARREKANKEAREARRPPGREPTPRKPSREEILENIERDNQFNEQKAQAATRGRVNAKLKWRDDMRRERDEKIAAVRNNQTLSDEEKLERIEEIEEAYGQALARG